MSRESKISVTSSPEVSVEPSHEEIRMQINLRLRLDELAEVEAGELRANAQKAPFQSELRDLASRIYDNRRARDRIMDRKIFGEPAWDMLLALYCLPARGEILTVTSLSLAASVNQTSGLRWQKKLTDEGLIERGPQGVDLRKQFMRLTDEGRDLMDRYLTHLYYCDVPVPLRNGRCTNELP